MKQKSISNFFLRWFFLSKRVTFSSLKERIFDMAKIIFEDTDEEFEIPDGAPIAEACEQAGVPFACTEGVCGTCVVEVTEGMDNLSEFNQAEADFLGELNCERLACQCKIKKGIVKLKF